MNEEYIEKPHAQNVAKVSVLHQQLSRTLDDEILSRHPFTCLVILLVSRFEIKLRSSGIDDEGEYVSYPILYQMQRIGDLRLGNGSAIDEENSVLSQITKRIARFLSVFRQLS